MFCDYGNTRQHWQTGVYHQTYPQESPHQYFYPQANDFSPWPF